MIKLSFHDLVHVTQGDTVADTLAKTADLAAHAEALGFTRYWIAEHHGLAGVASSATAVLIGHVAAATRTIRVGAGGIMLPNHAPLVVAEQFGTLDALYPGRIDLGLGRAPGGDGHVIRALRRTLQSGPNAFPSDVAELRNYFADDGKTGVVATPGAGAKPQIWILGSSLNGAKLAAALGLPYAFASHFAPDSLDQALKTYRREFRPSAQLAEPYVAAGLNVYAADSDEEAELIASSQQQFSVELLAGKPGELRPPVAGYRDRVGSQGVTTIDHVLRCSVAGGPAKIAAGFADFAERTKVDEIMVSSAIYDHRARRRSLEITAQVASQSIVESTGEADGGDRF
ncbi:LLM class flavin-dependent oxidoreductase [Pseudomonas chlororaphis]|uniref:LLM class flavin-dependent oxidoreductase n=1 Tax=Pseudomonas chlororaphis TaxID=587753 RepID=UPI0006A63A66|nr:LLM class flavin-dependent oxidoreductase [Pseudomonas chlororaphis]